MLSAAGRGRAVAGIIGPVVFTGAWIVSSLRQSGYPAAGIQISGLAAPDARDPWIMVAGFVVLGGCTVAFGGALQAALGGRGRPGPAPRLIQAAGLLTVAAGVLRRDRMLLTPGSVSWHNHAHDLIGVLIYLDLGLAPVATVAAGQRPGHRRAARLVRRRHVIGHGGRRAAGGGDHPAGRRSGYRGSAAQGSGAVRPAVTRG